MRLTVGFSKPKSPLALQGPIISAIMGAEYDHVYLEFKVEDQDLIFQASHMLVHAINKIEFLKSAIILKEYYIELTAEQEAKLKQFVLISIGRRYSTLGLIGILWVLLGRRFGKEWKNPFNDGDTAFFCSELVDAALDAAGLIHLENQDCVTPKDVHKLVEQHWIKYA
jgi:hypothetical protein